MRGGETDDWWGAIPHPARWVILGALLTSTGSGFVNFDKDASDRFKSQDFRHEISSRDAKISILEARQMAHLQHSAEYTQIIKQHIREIDALRRWKESHKREEH